MATNTLVTPEEYLLMAFDGPDREFVDGEVVERNEGERQHSEIQARLVEIFCELRKNVPLYCFPGLRLRLAETRYRIPDISVFAKEKPTESVPSSPPLVAIEIVSRDDRYTEITHKLEEYRAWGVPHVWLIDPWQKKLSVYGKSGLVVASSLALPEFDIEISAGEILG